MEAYYTSSVHVDYVMRDEKLEATNLTNNNMGVGDTTQWRQHLPGKCKKKDTEKNLYRHTCGNIYKQKTFPKDTSIQR